MHPSLRFVRLCCVKCRRERVVVAFWADDPDGWCDHGKLCPWAEHDDHEHGSLSLSLVPVSRA